MPAKCPQCKLKQFENGVCNVCGYGEGQADPNSSEYLASISKERERLFGAGMPRTLFLGIAAVAAFLIVGYYFVPKNEVDTRLIVDKNKSKLFSRQLLDTYGALQHANFVALSAASKILETTEAAGRGSDSYLETPKGSLAEKIREEYHAASKSLEQGKLLLEELGRELGKASSEEKRPLHDDAYAMLKEYVGKVEKSLEMAGSPSGTLRQYKRQYFEQEDARQRFMTNFSLLEDKLISDRDFTVSKAP